jgi:hypothetical protein
MGPIVTQVWVPHVNIVVTVVTNLNSSSSHVEWCNFYIHFRSMNAPQFSNGWSYGIKSLLLMSPSMVCLSVEFNENLPVGSKVISRGRREVQTD